MPVLWNENSTRIRQRTGETKEIQDFASCWYRSAVYFLDRGSGYYSGTEADSCQQASGKAGSWEQLSGKGRLCEGKGGFSGGIEYR